MRPKVNANGHRRRQVRARVLAEEEVCALCGELVDKDLPHLDPRSAVVDETLPRSRGGSSYDRSNCTLMHRACNRWKSSMTLDEAHAKLNSGESGNFSAKLAEKPVISSPIW